MEGEMLYDSLDESVLDDRQKARLKALRIAMDPWLSQVERCRENQAKPLALRMKEHDAALKTLEILRNGRTAS